MQHSLAKFNLDKFQSSWIKNNEISLSIRLFKPNKCQTDDNSTRLFRSRPRGSRTGERTLLQCQHWRRLTFAGLSSAGSEKKRTEKLSIPRNKIIDLFSKETPGISKPTTNPFFTMKSLHQPGLQDGQWVPVAEPKQAFPFGLKQPRRWVSLSFNQYS